MPADTRGQWEYSPVGRALAAIGWGERLGVKHILRPIAEAINPAIREQLEQQGGDIYGGDVFNAMFPPSERYPSPLEKAGRFVAGAAMGAPFDPLTYVTGGGLGARALRKQAAKSALGRTVHAGGRALQRGHAAEDLARQAASKAPVLDAIKLPEMARWWDRATINVSQKFGFNVGADPWLMRSHQELFSEITGAGNIRAGEVIDSMEPALERAARKFAVRLDISEEEALVNLRAAVTEASDMHPYIELARDAKRSQLYVKVGKTKTEWDMSRKAIQENFGLPPSWGGPAEASDTDLVRQVREIAIGKRREFNNAILEQERERLGHDIMMHTHPDAGYSAGIQSPEAKKWIEKHKFEELAGTVIGGQKKRARPYASPPSSHIAHEIARTMRVVDPVSYKEMADAGVFKPFKVRVVRRGKKVIKTVDPARLLENEVGGLISKRTLRLVNKLADSGVLSYDRTAPNYVGKLIPSMSTMDKNKWIWENGHGMIPPNTIRNFFEVDPTVIDVSRGMAADRAMLSKEWFDAVKTRTDLVRPVGAPDTPHEWIEVKGIPELQGHSMAPDEAKYVANMYEADVNLGPALRKFMKVVSQGNQSFKAWTLSLFPAYHSRNFIGAMWNYYLGMDDPIRGAANLRRSSSAWKAVRKGGQSAKAWKLEGTDYTAQDIWTEVEKRNGWGVGFISQENTDDIRRHVQYVKRWGVDDPAAELLRGARADWKAAGRKGKAYIGPPEDTLAEKIKLGFLGQTPFIERGFRVGSYVDDRIRMAHILQKLKVGETMEDAIRSMKKHFFDYHQLSPFEKQWAKQVIPFYAWSRKNIPFQLEMMVRRPDRLQRFHGGLQAWEGSEETPYDERYLNEWMRKNFSVRVRKNRNGQSEYFAFKNWLPLVDITEIFHGWEWLTQGLTPWARIPIELMTNFNWFTDRSIDHLNSVLSGERTRFGTFRGVLGEKYKLRGAALPNKLAHIIKSIRLPSTLHAILDNPQELDFYSQLGKVAMGRLYPLDVGRSQYHFAMELRNLEKQTRKAISSTMFKGEDQEAIDRLVELYLKKRKKVYTRRGMVG